MPKPHTHRWMYSDDYWKDFRKCERCGYVESPIPPVPWYLFPGTWILAMCIGVFLYGWIIG